MAVDVFEGNVADPKTLGSQIRKVRQLFGLRRVAMVGDRGMITEARIREELAPVEGLDWITALRGPAIRALAKAGVIQLSLFDERDLAEITSPEYPGERLIACRNPFLARSGPGGGRSCFWRRRRTWRRSWWRPGASGGD